MRIVAIVQARTGSTRLPGKVLADIAGRPMLARVLERVRAAQAVDEVVVATTTEQDDDRIVELAERLGVRVFRGSEDDVLDRYRGAAEAFAADAVVRVTSDCPLIDPGVVDEVIAAFRAQPADYASNGLERTYPRGLDTEVIARDALDTAWREATEPYERVHVTPFLYRRPERFRLVAIRADADYSSHRWTVDTQEDLDLVRELYRLLPDPEPFDWRDVLALVTAQPELAAMNRDVVQKSLSEL